ncbi:MAG: hypothetical protein LBK91_01750 [Synergistaceae bacterium]|jgi:hypothetical protein|nr:hypothetical protein [Synergistaceae bacterium]
MTEQPCDKYPPVTAYREVKIGRTVYQVTGVFTGEKELGPTLEKLAARRVLLEMDGMADTARD